MADQPIVVVAERTPPESPPPNESGNEGVLRQAEEFGRLRQAYETALSELAALKLQVEAGQASLSDLAALRSDLAQLRADLLETQDAIEEPDSDVTLIEPEPEPEPEAPELPPEVPKEPWFKLMLRI